MHKTIFSLSILLVTATFLFSCSATKKATTTEATSALTYTKDVKPIIDEYCGTKCHSATKKASGIDLSNYAGVRHESVDGDLLGAIQHGEGYRPMPKNGEKLSDETIQMISAWVLSGAKE